MSDCRAGVRVQRSRRFTRIPDATSAAERDTPRTRVCTRASPGAGWHERPDTPYPARDTAHAGTPPLPPRARGCGGRGGSHTATAVRPRQPRSGRGVPLHWLWRTGPRRAGRARRGPHRLVRRPRSAHPRDPRRADAGRAESRRPPRRRLDGGGAGRCAHRRVSVSGHLRRRAARGHRERPTQWPVDRHLGLSSDTTTSVVRAGERRRASLAQRRTPPCTRRPGRSRV
ncbi:hypothetical protein SAMN04488074_14327 [Lentzea albidocapillata subsp. violacea]|uniref:Uncharacterized protein n=1 Tax=Lentzea albidocapillata subsp. violacea TaxID=128104 RepID=A0A1H0A3H7_9PSEU|nr:hypothetical protein SAMN04488074_14327 [Lentzea albidocapillata subsp. violacea]